MRERITQQQDQQKRQKLLSVEKDLLNQKIDKSEQEAKTKQLNDTEEDILEAAEKQTKLESQKQKYTAELETLRQEIQDFEDKKCA